MSIVSGVTYTIKGSYNNETAKYISVSGGGWCLHGNEPKKYSKWTFTPRGNDRYTIKALAGKYQGSYELSFRNLTGAVGMYKNGGSIWELEKCEGNWYYIRLRNQKYEDYYLSRSNGNWCYLYSSKSDASKYLIEPFTPWKVLRIDYDISIKPTNSKVLASDKTTEKNNTSLQQTNTFKFSKTVSTRKEYVQTSGFTIGTSASFEAKLPVLGGTDITLSTEYSQETTKTDEKAQSTEITLSRSCVIPPYSQTTATLLVLGSSARIPYTIVYENMGVTRTAKGHLNMDSVTETTISLDEQPLNK
ncbi:natterin-4 [Anaeramoeba flamelloides]|uniref:Natterin-4 n=1 Tax=Anaeramoeba flamelloides TaxID=1746091 RepID=A0ABQ8YEV9_9EUKA|nr:natterin-4 [Anaeramoeba flamelloides]